MVETTYLIPKIEIYRQSSVKIALGNFTPSFHFSVKLPYISFLTHHKCKSLN